MPIYEYHCPQCDAVFSERRRISQADEPTTCPECGASEAKRKISMFAAHSAGGGVIAGGSGGGCNGCAATSCSTCRSGS